MKGKKISYALLKKARFWARVLSFFPGIEAIFLSGSLAQGKANQNSDIDFFILATPGRIWTARFWVFFILKITRNLAKPANHKGRICPNHFITTDSLEIADKNAYSANLFSHNQPLYDPQNFFQAFALANTWVTEFGEAFPVQVIENGESSKVEFSQKRSVFESLLKKVQIAKIKKNPDFNNNPEAKIITTDQELRFHPHPRSKYWKKNKDEIEELEIHNPYKK